jgi:hypothetical protein
MVLFIIFMNISLALSSECNNIMRSFFRNDDGKTIPNKTAEMDITKYGLMDNIINREKFERLYLQCMSGDKNELKELAHKRFSTAHKTLSVAASIIGYTEMNWEKPKDKEWFERLGYGIAFGAVIGKIYGKLIKENGSRFQFLVKDYLFGRGATLAYLGGFTLFFDNNKEDRQKLEKLKASPTFNEDIKKLKEYADNDAIVARYQKELMAYLSHLEVINLGIGVHDGVDFDNLKPADLKDKDIQKVVIAAILAQEYEQQKGLLTVTGGKTGDYFLFDSLYAIAKIPKDLLVNQMVDRVMCLNSHNVSRGLTQAIGISVLNQILFADYYSITYTVLKKELIDQNDQKITSRLK